MSILLFSLSNFVSSTHKRCSKKDEVVDVHENSSTITISPTALYPDIESDSTEYVVTEDKDDLE